MTERLRVRAIDDAEGRRLVRIIRRGSGSAVTWRRAQMVLLPAQGMGLPAIAKVAFTSEDHVRDVIRNFSAWNLNLTLREVASSRSWGSTNEPGESGTWPLRPG